MVSGYSSKPLNARMLAMSLSPIVTYVGLETDFGITNQRL